MIGWRVALWVVLVGTVVYFLYLVRSVVAPFLLAGIISAILEPMCRRLHKRGLPWGASVLTVTLTIFFVATGILIWLMPQMTRQVVNFRDKAESVSTRIAAQTAQDNYFMRWNPRFIVSTDPLYRELDAKFAENEGVLKRAGLPTNRRIATSQYVEPYRQEITKLTQSAVQGLLGTIGVIGSNAFLYGFVPVFVILILWDVDRFKNKAASWIPPSIRAETVDLISDIANVFLRFLRGISIVVVWYVVVAAAVMSLLGVPYALLLAPLFGLIYLIPPIGGFINAGLVFVITGLSGKTDAWFYTFPSPWVYAGVCVAVYLAVFTVFDQVVYTRIVGGSVGLPPLLSFFVVFSAGALFGPVGMVVAFPVAGAAKIILDRLLAITSKPTDLHLPAVPMRHRSG